MLTDKDNILDDLKRNDEHINQALDEIGIPRDDGLAIFSTWGRVSIVLERLAQLEAAQRPLASEAQAVGRTLRLEGCRGA